mgnify:CR=1 FL=1
MGPEDLYLLVEDKALFLQGPFEFLVENKALFPEIVFFFECSLFFKTPEEYAF